jgi:circadian clock protein KaiC
MQVQTVPKTSTGITGLDYILDGGFPEGQFILAQGAPGTGKTTLGLQFLIEGARKGERTLYISFLHAKRDIERIAGSHGLSLEGVETAELSSVGGTEYEQTIFHTDEVELGETINTISDIVERVSPQRLVFDSISELQLLSGSSYRCRQNVASLKRLLAARNCTSLFMVGESDGNQRETEHISDGIILLQQSSPDFGVVRRCLEIIKMRGMAYITGRHDFRIKTGGLEIYPRLQALSSRVSPTGIEIQQEERLVATGVKELDAMLGGGMEEGSTTLLLGAAGTGKSTITSVYAHSAAKEGTKSLILLFDESIRAYCQRAKNLGLDLYPSISSGMISIRRISVGEISPGEFTQIVRLAIEEDGVRLLIIDTLTGYLVNTLEEKSLLTQFHELLAYTGDRDVLTIMTVTEHGLIGSTKAEPESISLLADTVILIRYFEAYGRIKRAMTVFKKRYGEHETVIREMTITSEGISVGKPLEHFSGILTGEPSFSGKKEDLMEQETD